MNDPDDDDDLEPAPIPAGVDLPPPPERTGGNPYPPTNNGRSVRKLALANRRRQVASLALARMQERDIARLLGCSRDAVKRDKAVVLERWRSAAERDVLEMRAEAAAGLDADEVRLRGYVQKLEGLGKYEEALEAWDRVIKIQERRAKLLGLDAPIQTEVRFPASWKGGVLRDESRPVELVASVAALLIDVGAFDHRRPFVPSDSQRDPGAPELPAGGAAGGDRVEPPAEAHPVHPDHADG